MAIKDNVHAITMEANKWDTERSAMVDMRAGFAANKRHNPAKWPSPTTSMRADLRMTILRRWTWEWVMPATKRGNSAKATEPVPRSGSQCGMLTTWTPPSPTAEDLSVIHGPVVMTVGSSRNLPQEGPSTGSSGNG